MSDHDDWNKYLSYRVTSGMSPLPPAPALPAPTDLERNATQLALPIDVKDEPKSTEPVPEVNDLVKAARRTLKLRAKGKANPKIPEVLRRVAAANGDAQANPAERKVKPVKPPAYRLPSISTPSVIGRFLALHMEYKSAGLRTADRPISLQVMTNAAVMMFLDMPEPQRKAALKRYAVLFEQAIEHDIEHGLMSIEVIDGATPDPDEVAPGAKQVSKRVKTTRYNGRRTG